MKWINQISRVVFAAALLCVPCHAQNKSAAAPPSPPKLQIANASNDKQQEEAVGLNYILGAQDQLSLWSLNAEEFAGKTVQIDTTGQINLPLVGRVQAAGLTTQQLESEVSKRLATYIKTPQISITVTEYQSQPVSVIGAVNNPGVHKLRGQSTLLQVLSTAGGLRQDAGNSLKITRRIEYGPIPIETAAEDSTKKFSTAEISIKSLMEARKPEENIPVLPFDVISVPRAEMVYVVGEVEKPGGFVLIERERISVLEALSLAGGLNHFAAAGNARLLRPTGDNTGEREEISVNLKEILQGKATDLPMRFDDILFVPGSGSKRAATRAADFVLQTVSGVVIWRSRY
jgi:polysaccharide export outer membrane protein